MLFSFVNIYKVYSLYYVKLIENVTYILFNLCY